MTQKHTPGPWEWWASCSWKRLTSKDENGKWMKEGNVLCPCVDSDGHPNLDVSPEDMALIAAAPDLLEALKGSLASLVASVSLLKRGGKKAAPSDKMFDIMVSDYERSIEFSRAVIAKAKGGAA